MERRLRRIITIAVTVILSGLGVAGSEREEIRLQNSEGAQRLSRPLGLLPSTSPLSAEGIMARTIEANRWRDAMLQRYTALRTYRAMNFRFKKSATLQALVTFESPETKRITVLSEEGSGAIRKKVFRRMIEGELDALKPALKQRSAMTTDNYTFALLGEEEINGRPCYVLEAEPRRQDKYLFRGQLWIDASDFAVVRIKGSPAQMPSFWTRKIEFVREYQKIGPFWLPAKDESLVQVFIFGKSHVTVEHSNYQIEFSQGGNP